VITTSQEKQDLSEIADAVEMESFEILNEASNFGIPAAAIRAVSDLASENLPLDLNEVFTIKGQLSVPRVLGQVTLHPGSVPGLVKLGQQTKRAAEALANFLNRYVDTLAERARNLEARAAAL
jgi:Phosphorylase superfamily